MKQAVDAARAYGPRLAYRDLPAPVRTWVEMTLGAAVVEARTQVGGFSPGTAARVRTADGARAFVKAAGTSLNPHTPALLRTEIAVLAELGPSPLRPALRAAYDETVDDDAWVALILEDLDGATPRLPWQPKALGRVVEALDSLASTHTPTPRPYATHVSDQVAGWLTSWSRIAAAPPPDLDPWEARHLHRLEALAEETRGHLSHGDTCVHLDIRSDNIVIAPQRVAFVDWNWSATGPDWVDTMLLALEVSVTGGAAQQLLATAPRTRNVDPGVLTAFLAVALGMLEETRRAPGPAGLPRLRAFQAAYAAGGLAWLRQRTGWV